MRRRYLWFPSSKYYHIYRQVNDGVTAGLCGVLRRHNCGTIVAEAYPHGKRLCLHCQKKKGVDVAVKEILIEALKAKGFDGLFYENECGCQLSDLIPCQQDFSNCEPGYKVPCIPDECNADGDCKFHISAVRLSSPKSEKPKEKKELPTFEDMRGIFKEEENDAKE